jgi:hypothetical protein
VTSSSSLPVPCICFLFWVFFFVHLLQSNCKTPFYNAVSNGRVDAMKYLIELGAKYDGRDSVSNTHPCIFVFSHIGEASVCDINFVTSCTIHLFSAWQHSYS